LGCGYDMWFASISRVAPWSMILDAVGVPLLLDSKTHTKWKITKRINSGLRISSILPVVFLMFFFAGPAAAVDFFDGIRASRGLYFLSYSSLYRADRITGPGGHTEISDYGFLRAEQILRLCYYSPDYVFNLLVPFGGSRTDQPNASSYGIGDIWLGTGTFLPFREVDALFMFSAKLPTGKYSVNDSVNFGSNQIDLSPGLFVHKIIADFSFDAAVKYYFKLENHDTDTDPGDEVHLQLLLGYEFADGIRAGPALNWIYGKNKEIGGRSVPGSARQLLSAGGEIYFKISSWAITLNYLHDAYSENSTRGDYFKIKLCHKL